MNKFCKVLIFVVIALSVFFVSPSVEANEGEQVGYSVQAVLPENQRDNGATYFDLLVEEDSSYQLEVQIFNHANEELTVNVTPTTSSTNQNGLIVYEEQETYDDSLKFPISELVTIEEPTVTIPANETATVEMQLTLPDEKLEGFLLGGILIQKESTQENEQEGVQIQNEYAYVIGLQATMDEQVVDPNLNLDEIRPELVNYRTAVIAELQNDQPVIMNGVDITAEVYKANNPDEVFKTSTIEDGSFAPNSTMDFVIDWENQYLEPGDYRLKLTATDDESKWQWDEKFTISEEEGQISDDAVELEEDSWITPQLFIGVIAVLIIIIIVLLFRNRKSK